MRTQNFSDISLPLNKSRVVARDSLYSDLNLSFIPNPVTGDINPVRDIEAIKKSVVNLILTNFYERPFQPEIGSGVRGLLFELADPITISDIEDAAQQVLENFEPRISVLEVVAVDDADNNSYTLSITFQILSTEQIADVTAVLERIR
jgi:phage baseplate assembly protein W